jgi:hypothetical protein
MAEPEFLINGAMTMKQSRVSFNIFSRRRSLFY